MNNPKCIIKVFVCHTCDRDPARVDTDAAEGAGFAKEVRALLELQDDVVVKGMNCMGGCECDSGGAPNGCCTVGFASVGRFSYVFHKLNPLTDAWMVLEFLKLYRMKPDGRITVADSERSAELTGRIATRVPAA